MLSDEMDVDGGDDTARINNTTFVVDDANQSYDLPVAQMEE